MDQEIAKKTVQCIDILFENMPQAKKNKYFKICTPITWVKIIQVFDSVYKMSNSIMIDLIRVVAKMFQSYCLVVQLGTGREGRKADQEDENSLCDFIEALIAILKRSDDSMLLAAAVDSLMDVFSEENLDRYFIKYELYRLLRSGEAAFCAQLTSHLDYLKSNGGSDQDMDHLGEVLDNFPKFLDYKREHLDF